MRITYSRLLQGKARINTTSSCTMQQTECDWRLLICQAAVASRFVCTEHVKGCAAIHFTALAAGHTNTNTIISQQSAGREHTRIVCTNLCWD